MYLKLNQQIFDNLDLLNKILIFFALLLNSFLKSLDLQIFGQSKKILLNFQIFLRSRHDLS